MLRIRDDQIVLTEGDAGFRCLSKTHRHHAVCKDTGLFLATMTIYLINDLGNLTLGQETVDQTERYVRAARENFREIHPARCRNHDRADRITLFVDCVVTRLDPGVQRDGIRRNRMLDLADIREPRHAVCLQRAIFECLQRFRGILRRRLCRQVLRIAQDDVMALKCCFKHVLTGNLDFLTNMVQPLVRQIVEAQYNILRRNDDRLAVRGRQNVVRRHHKNAGFQLRFE